MSDRLSWIHDERFERVRVERALIAHVMLNPGVLGGRRRPRLSPAAAALLDIVLEAPGCSRLDWQSHVMLALRFIRHVRYHLVDEARAIHLLQCTQRARYRDVVRHARVIEAFTIADLSPYALDVEDILGVCGATLRPRLKRTAGDRLYRLEVPLDEGAEPERLALLPGGTAA